MGAEGSLKDQVIELLNAELMQNIGSPDQRENAFKLPQKLLKKNKLLDENKAKLSSL